MVTERSQGEHPAPPHLRTEPATDIALPKESTITTAASTAADTVAGAVVEFKNVTLQYNAKVVLDRLSFRVLDGENMLLVGGNGAGKSSIIDLISGENQRAYGCPIWLFGRRKPLQSFRNLMGKEFAAAANRQERFASLDALAARRIRGGEPAWRTR